MPRVQLAAAVLTFALLSGAARAQNDADNDAPVGTRSPAVEAWRAPSAAAAGSRPPLMQTGDSSGLLDDARRAVGAEPDGKAKADLLGALDDLNATAAKQPADRRQGWIDAHLGDYNETLRTLGADAPAPLVVKAAKAAAKLNGRAERWDDAREFADKALKLAPDDADALTSRSQADAGLGDFTSAYSDAERASKLAPNSSDAYTARAAAAYGLGNYLQALEDARRALALDAENKTAFALMKLSEGRSNKAPDFEGREAPQIADSVEREYHGMVQQLNQVEERRLAPIENPGPVVVARFVSSSGAKLSVKDYRGAIDDADRALALDADNARALYFRAAAHNLIGEYGDAVRDATRGLTASPNDAALRDARAWAYNRMGRYQDATADAHFALESDPNDGYAFANRAYADEGRGDYGSMADDYKAAAKLNPQFEATYLDATRRHGLAAEPLTRGAGARPAAPPSKGRRLGEVAIAAVLAGLLIVFGVLQVGTIAEAPVLPTPSVPTSGVEAGYEIGKAIGQGGMGVVYEAVDRKLKRPVAIKMLRDEFQLDESAKEGFLAEARTVAELHHSSIVDIHAIVEDARGLYLVFERLDGRTLDQLIAEKRRLNLRDARRILGPVCEALEYAHSRDVVHRDLKPSNIMLTSEGGVKVLDFGISRHAARGCKAATTQTITGTPHYMAPEQEYGVVRKENDVFSLGAVLYELVGGERPFDGAHAAKLAKSYPKLSAKLPGVPPELDALIDEALEPDPDKRLKSPGEFWKRLLAVPDFG